MNLDEILSSWLALDDLFTEERMYPSLLESFDDESGSVILSHILSPLGASEWTEDTFVWNVEWFLSVLYGALKAKLRLLEEEDKYRAMLKGMKTAMKGDPNLAKSFTAKEAVGFIQAIDKGHNISLNLLDQITGLYLGLKALNTDGDFQVESLIVDTYTLLEASSQAEPV